MDKTTSQTPSIIAIDGPAASGKSTIGSRLAKTLGYLFFDTGVMYRAITWLVLERGIDLHDEAAVTALAEEAQIDVAPASKPDGRACDVLVNGRDITWEIRTRRVDENVSLIAAYRGVRRALSQQQRRIGQRGRIVMVGRDIGTVVLPEADLKIYLDATAATLSERNRRRATGVPERVLRTLLHRLEIPDLTEAHPEERGDRALEVRPDPLPCGDVSQHLVEPALEGADAQADIVAEILRGQAGGERAEGPDEGGSHGPAS